MHYVSAFFATDKAETKATFLQTPEEEEREEEEEGEEEGGEEEEDL